MNAEIAFLNEALAGRYAIARQLGRGETATVYLASDTRCARKVALKLLDREIMTEVVGQRFLREIGIAARLHHPHIIELIDSGEADGRPFFVMPLVEGATLRELLDSEQQLPISEAVRLGCEIAGALAYAHAEGVVHRDIKPENILLAGYFPGQNSKGQSHAFVADFGVARAVIAGSEGRLTGSHFIVGTPAYMSPEQLDGGQELDGRTDQYSLGCVLYEMLVGQPPFDGGSTQAAYGRRFIEAPLSARMARPEIPVAVECVIMQALSLDPADRFTAMQQLSDALCASLGAYALGAKSVATPAMAPCFFDGIA